MEKAAALRPAHPRLIYNLADAYALNGNAEKSIYYLNQLVQMKLFYAVEKDADFDSLKNNSQFQK